MFPSPPGAAIIPRSDSGHLPLTSKLQDTGSWRKCFVIFAKPISLARTCSAQTSHHTMQTVMRLRPYSAISATPELESLFRCRGARSSTPSQLGAVQCVGNPREPADCVGRMAIHPRRFTSLLGVRSRRSVRAKGQSNIRPFDAASHKHSAQTQSTCTSARIALDRMVCAQLHVMRLCCSYFGSRLRWLVALGSGRWSSSWCLLAL